MDTDLLDRVRGKLVGAKRGRLERIADAGGICRGTFRKIIAGKTLNPRFDTVRKIAAVERRIRWIK